MKCPRCNGHLYIWVSYRSPITGEIVSHRYRDEADVIRSMGPLAITKYDVLPYVDCQACMEKYGPDAEGVSALFQTGRSDGGVA